MSDLEAIKDYIEDLVRNETAVLKEVRYDQRGLEEDLDNLYILLNGIIIYFLQAGFGFLECGSVRAKNATNILLKNLLDSFIGAFAYWWFGWAFAFGEGNAFLGFSQFGLVGIEANKYAKWFFYYTFAATTATIVSGAVAERCTLTAYFVYSFMLTGFVYPIASHWGTEQGWLYEGITYTDNGENITVRYQDFSGSGAVHTLGGVAAFMGALFLGPRIGRFDDNGKPIPIPGHSVPLVSLGAFILVMGFLSFNGGSLGQISQPGQGDLVALIIVNTILSASAGSLTCLLYRAVRASYQDGKMHWSLEMCILGCLSGLVAICSGADVVRPWSAMVTGIIAGFCLIFTKWLVLKLKVDDPLDATAAHAGPGIWGVVASVLFDADKGILYKWDKRSLIQLGWNLLGVSAIIVWTIFWGLLIFGLLKKFKLLRVDEEYEVRGLDFIKHGGVAYPHKAQGDGWHNTTPRYSMELKTHIPTSYLKQLSIDSVKEIDENTNADSTSIQDGTSSLKKRNGPQENGGFVLDSSYL